VVATAGALAFGIHRWILASRRERQAQLQKREDARDAREKALWDAIHRHEDKVLGREADRARHEALRAEVARLSDEVRELGIKVDGMSDRLTVLESKFEMFVEFVIPHAQPARHPHAGHLPE